MISICRGGILITQWEVSFFVSNFHAVNMKFVLSYTSPFVGSTFHYKPLPNSNMYRNSAYFCYVKWVESIELVHSHGTLDLN